MKMPSKPLSWGITLGVVALAMVAVTVLRGRNAIEYASPEHRSILEAIYGLGKVKADRHYEVKLGVMTSVREVLVSEGQAVKKGDALIRFEAASFRSPFDGTVTSVTVAPNEVIVPNVPVIRVEDLSQLYLEVALEQQSALRVRPGMIARMTFDSVRGDQYSGKLESVYSRNEEFLARIRSDKLPNGILPGMTADIVIEVGTKENALIVPLTSITEGSVMVERDGKRIKIPVEVGIVDGKKAEIIKGDIRDADRIILPRKASGKTDPLPSA
jgi:multidrug efflux pump subunit AcrA (membrane-fusion protein)